LKNEKSKNIRLNLVSNHENYMESFRDNIGILRTDFGWSVRVLAEKANISEDTLQTFLKGKSKDCNLSTAVKLARAFGITVDELIGAETMDPQTQESVAMSSNLKDHHRYVIRAYVKHQYKIHGDVPKTSKQISVMMPECHHGYLKTTNVTEALNIDHLYDSTRSKVCLGLRVPCAHYEPYYMQNEILLLAADRDGLNNERCVITHAGNFYICIKRIIIENGKKSVKYLSLMDGRNVLFDHDEIDDKIGYVVGFLYPDGAWGVR